MRIEEFDYDLPADRIAQVPAATRDGSRLMIVDRRADGVEESTFTHLAGFLKPGDLLVLNDTRVLPVRLRGRKPTGGRIEVLLIPPPPTGSPDAGNDAGVALEPDASAPGDGGGLGAILSTSKGIRPGVVLDLGEGIAAEVLEAPAEGRARLRFRRAGAAPTAGHGRTLPAHGVMPLPPYIHREPDDARDALDRERYQTVYAAHDGAIAAPTAGLHFTPDMLTALPRRGIEVIRITLHVGPGTFLPIRVPAIEDHSVEAEWCRVPREAAEAVAACRRRGGRVAAVGTTVVRALEGRAGGDGVLPGEGPCDLTIRPGHRFRVVDMMVTNLHLPRSSLLILVAAFAGRERILSAYAEAVRRGFRFYSYGDAMLIR